MIKKKQNPLKKRGNNRNRKELSPLDKGHPQNTPTTGHLGGSVD